MNRTLHSDLAAARQGLDLTGVPQPPPLAYARGSVGRSVRRSAAMRKDSRQAAGLHPRFGAARRGSPDCFTASCARGSAATGRSRLRLCWLWLFAFLLPAAFAQEAFQLKELRAERYTVVQGGYFPRLAALPNGDLVAFFKTGAAHIGKSGRASMSRSTDGGKTWSPPRTVFDIPNADDGIDANGLTRAGRLMAAAVSYTWNGERYTTDGWKADTYFLDSADQGKTWSKPVKVNIAPFQWAYPFGQILEEADGTLLMTCYGGSLPRQKDQVETTFLVRSKDGGRSWGDSTTLHKGYNEISMIRRKDGSLLAVMRSHTGAHLAATVSTDRGRTWSAPVNVTEDQEHPGDLLRLPSGELLLTFGQRNKPYGVQAMISRDDGATWDRKNRMLLAWDGDHRDLGYPVTVNLKGGRLATIYYVVYGERDPEGTKGIAPKNAFCRVVAWSPAGR